MQIVIIIFFTRENKKSAIYGFYLEPLSRLELLTYSFAYTSISAPRARYKRTRLYLERIPISRNLALLVSRSGVSMSDATVLTLGKVFNRNSECTGRFLFQGQGLLRPTMELLYQLSYNGICFDVLQCALTLDCRPHQGMKGLKKPCNLLSQARLRIVTRPDFYHGVALPTELQRRNLTTYS